MHNVKVENDVLFRRHTEDLSPGGSFSDGFEGLFQRVKGGTKIYRIFCNKNQVAEHPKFTVN